MICRILTALSLHSTSVSLRPSLRGSFREDRRRQRPRLLRYYASVDGDDAEEEENEEESTKLTGPLQGMESTVERMLLESPAVKSAIARISAASERYEASLRKKAELELQGLTHEQREEIAEITEHRVLAQAEVEAAKKRMKAAELRLLMATEEQQALEVMANETDDRGVYAAIGCPHFGVADKIESVKSFTVSSLSGMAALLPILIVEANDLEHEIINLLATAFSSGLFGITYRYAVGDGKNPQLKFGVVAAFWICLSLSLAEMIWSSISEPLSHLDIRTLNNIGQHSVQTLIILLASSLALEVSFRSGFIQYAVSSQQD